MVEAVFVQGTDYKYYRNPIVYGDNWFIEFEDNELPEIIVKRFEKTNEKSALRRMRSILNKAGFKYKIKANVARTVRVFPPKFQGFDDALATFFELRDLVPVENIKVHDQGVLTLFPEADGTYFTFFDPFPMAEIIKLINGKPSQKLVSWLTGLDKMSPSAITSAKRELFKQYLELDTTKGTLHLRRKIR